MRDIVANIIPDYSTVGYNLLTCFETMEHIAEKDVDRVLSELFDRLNPGGEALFTICLNDRPGWDSDPTHITIKDRGWWDERLQRAGFRHDLDRYQQIRRFHLYADHNGVYTVRKPTLREQ
jgi:SAM-dependent methyltransferase